MWKMGINNSYTLEASICGSNLGETILCGYLVGIIKQDLYFWFFMENSSLSYHPLVGVLSYWVEVNDDLRQELEKTLKLGHSPSNLSGHR